MSFIFQNCVLALPTIDQCLTESYHIEHVNRPISFDLY